MTNFIYNMQDELFHLNMILPVGEFSPIKKLVDHIEAQGKQLRELNAAITKRNKTIEKYEREKKELQKNNSYLIKKVGELNEGIRNSEDLTWKKKYEALLHSSEQAISALQKKCQEYKNSESDATANTIEALVKENNELEHSRNELKKRLNGLYGEKASNYIQLELVCHKHEETIEHLEKALEDEKQVSKDLNTIINSKNNLLDEYMTKNNKLESELMDYIKENSKLRAKIARIGGMCDGIKKIVKE